MRNKCYPNLRMEMFIKGVSQMDLARHLGKDKYWIDNRMRGITKFPEEIKKSIKNKFFRGMSIEYLFFKGGK